MTRILVAPDKFKGSLTAPDVAEAVRRGLLSARGDLEVLTLPVADGGDGTLEAAVAAGFQRVELTAAGPTGEPTRTAFGRRDDTAVVEMADVSGLSRLPGGKLQPLLATSRGTGEVIAAAVDDGCQRVVLGIGGSACTDGGAGMLQALGARVSDAAGHEVGWGGAALQDVHTVALDGLMKRLRGVELVVACDVDNPLTGEHGAAVVYGPQKGASSREVTLLDDALTSWADAMARTTGTDLRDIPGAGAAGGVGFGALVAGAALRPGIDLILELLEFDKHLDGVDLVIVGEGSLDEQSLRGKAPVGVAQAAAKGGASAAGRRCPRVVAVCGRQLIGDDQLRLAGIESTYALTDLEPDPRASMANAARLLEQVGRRIAQEEVPAP